MKNYEIIFYIKNNEKKCTVLNKITKKHKDINYNDAIMMLKEIGEKAKKDKSFIKNIRLVNNDVVFNAEDFNIRICNIYDFQDEKDFYFIVNLINKKERKKQNKKKKIIASSMAALTFSTFIPPLLSKENDNIDNIKLNDLKDDVKVVQNEDDNLINELSIGTLSNDQKVLNVKEKYGNIINKYCDLYDLNYDVICALAAQERSIHSTERDIGGAIGLFQIQVEVWDNQTLDLYDKDGNNYESLHATLDKLKDIDFNCHFGCAYFRYCLDKMKGNYILALQCYNMGEGSLDKVLTLCSISTGISKDEIISDKTNFNWIKYIPYDMPGDSNYVSHVMRYYSGDNSIFKTNTLKR